MSIKSDMPDITVVYTNTEDFCSRGYFARKKYKGFKTAQKTKPIREWVIKMEALI